MNLNSGINTFVNSHANSKLVRGVKFQRAWERLAPTQILKHTDNVVESKKQKNAITVFVDAPHIAAELSMSKEYYRQMMEYETQENISNIFFIVSKETGIRKQFIKENNNQPWYQDNCDSIPLDDGELAYVKMSVQCITDEKLRETLFNALVSDMEWKKGIEAQKTS